jgi:hypothetical protein
LINISFTLSFCLATKTTKVAHHSDDRLVVSTIPFYGSGSEDATAGTLLHSQFHYAFSFPTILQNFAVWHVYKFPERDFLFPQAQVISRPGSQDCGSLHPAFLASGIPVKIPPLQGKRNL